MKIFIFIFIFMILFVSCGEDCKKDEVYNPVLEACVIDACIDYNPKFETCKNGCITNDNTKSYTCLIYKDHFDSTFPTTHIIKGKKLTSIE